MCVCVCARARLCVCACVYIRCLYSVDYYVHLCAYLCACTLPYELIYLRAAVDVQAFCHCRAGEVTLQGSFYERDTIADVKRRLFAAEAAAGQAVRVIGGGRELSDDVFLRDAPGCPTTARGARSGVLRLHAAVGRARRPGPAAGAAAAREAPTGPPAPPGSLAAGLRAMVAVFGVLLSLAWYAFSLATHLFSMPVRAMLLLFTLLWLRPAAACAPCLRVVGRGPRPRP